MALTRIESAPRHPHYASVSADEWADWRWQQQHRVTSRQALSSLLTLSADEAEAIDALEDRFRMAITPYYLGLIDPEDPHCPIRRQAVPSLGELRVWPGERPDPLAEELHSPAPGLTHRYPDRVLLYTNHNCAMYCRFCTRKRKVSDPDSAPRKGELDEAIEYIRRTPSVKDVIVSGGDPLSLSNERLAAIFEALSDIEHVETARIGTRNLVTLPQRVDAGFAEVLKTYQSRRLAIWVMTHFNHPREVTTEAWDACDRILTAGTPIQNQMVLLAGVNDRSDVVIDLNRRLLRMRVKPYYILHADLEEGIGHFRVPIATGKAIMADLRGPLSGLGVPQYVVDLPEGGGKVPVIPDYELSRPPEDWRFRNWQGRSISLRGGG